MDQRDLAAQLCLAAAIIMEDAAPIMVTAFPADDAAGTARIAALTLAGHDIVRLAEAATVLLRLARL